MTRFALAALLVACGGSSPEVVVDSGTPDVAKASSFAVSGVVVDDASAPLSGAKVQVCNASLCVIASADTTGAFHATVPPGAGYHAMAHAPGNTSAGIRIVGDVAADIALTAPIVVPTLGTAIPFSNGTADVTIDLTLATDATDIPTIAAASIPQEQWPAFATSGNVVAVWALAPWATHDAIDVTIANHFGLTAATVYAVDETTAEVGAPATATVTSATITAKIDRVTWIVLAAL